MYETKNMENYEDVIIGNSFFLDQIYEIDYDKNIIIIYDNLPKIEPDFVKQDMILDNGVRPVFEASFSIEGKIYKDWFLFDTGNTSNGILGNGFLKRNNLYDKFSTILASVFVKFSSGTDETLPFASIIILITFLPVNYSPNLLEPSVILPIIALNF